MMDGVNPFYHQSLRRLVAVFGSFFNSVSIERYESDGTTLHETIKVPITYSPKEPFIYRINSQPDLLPEDKNYPEINMVLPRMAFNMTSLEYDASRQTNKLNKFHTVDTDDADKVKMSYNRVPFNVGFELYIASRTLHDALHILEQILPYFTPEFNFRVIELPDTLNLSSDIPVIMEGVNTEVDYAEGSYGEDTKRTIIFTIQFTARMYFYGPVTSSNIIKTAIVNINDTENTSKKYEKITEAVNPSTANIDDVYTILETIESFDNND